VRLNNWPDLIKKIFERGLKDTVTVQRMKKLEYLSQPDLTKMPKCLTCTTAISWNMKMQKWWGNLGQR